MSSATRRPPPSPELGSATELIEQVNARLWEAAGFPASHQREDPVGESIVVISELREQLCDQAKRLGRKSQAMAWIRGGRTMLLGAFVGGIVVPEAREGLHLAHPFANEALDGLRALLERAGGLAPALSLGALATSTGLARQAIGEVADDERSSPQEIWVAEAKDDINRVASKPEVSPSERGRVGGYTRDALGPSGEDKGDRRTDQG